MLRLLGRGGLQGAAHVLECCGGDQYGEHRPTDGVGVVARGGQRGGGVSRYSGHGGTSGAEGQNADSSGLATECRSTVLQVGLELFHGYYLAT